MTPLEVMDLSKSFGGVTAIDLATGQAYNPNGTWEFDGTRWIRRFPGGDQPPGRSSHIMVYDSNRDRIVMFGGRSGNDLLDDTWLYRGDWFNREWVRLDTPNAPVARQFAAAAFDPLRDRTILFGGQRLVEDAEGNLSFSDVYDTWEFDGTTWTRVLENGPELRKPVLAYDAARDELILLGERLGAEGARRVLHQEPARRDQRDAVDGDLDRRRTAAAGAGEGEGGLAENYGGDPGIQQGWSPAAG